MTSFPACVTGMIASIISGAIWTTENVMCLGELITWGAGFFRDSIDSGGMPAIDVEDERKITELHEALEPELVGTEPSIIAGGLIAWRVYRILYRMTDDANLKKFWETVYATYVDVMRKVEDNS